MPRPASAPASEAVSLMPECVCSATKWASIVVVVVVFAVFVLVAGVAIAVRQSASPLLQVCLSKCIINVNFCAN